MNKYKLSLYYKNGKPWIPVMGECHFCRIHCDKWEETLQKMKDGGIDVVASYVFWIHHEEEKGKFNFDGNRNIRQFIKLCHKLGVAFCLRIGPWAHGECRNGGFPNWLCQECTSSIRSNQEPYFGYVKRYFHAIADQVRDCDLFGIQVENEMIGQSDYMEQLRQEILATGLHAPLFTACGWGWGPLDGKAKKDFRIHLFPYTVGIRKHSGSSMYMS